MLMNPPNMRAIYEEAIERATNGDLKDTKNSRGWNYVEEFARQMLLAPRKAAGLIAKASTRGCLPGVKASVERAVALNAPKLALLATAERCKKRGGFRGEGPAPVLSLDLPYKLHRLDPERYGEHVYVPTDRYHRPLGQEARYEGGSYEDHAGQAWHFRRDFHGLYFYTLADRHLTDRAFLAIYRVRLRCVLAEAVPGVGGLSLEPEW
jgi:hypothetical protein